jgi:hypothetical protein
MSEDDYEGAGFVYPVRFAALVVFGATVGIVLNATGTDISSASSRASVCAVSCGAVPVKLLVAGLSITAVGIAIAWVHHRLRDRGGE